MVHLEVHDSLKRVKFIDGRQLQNYDRYIKFDEFELGSNADTSFIPWYSIFMREYIKDSKDTYVYHKPKVMTNGMISISQYDDMFTVMNSGQLNGGTFHFTIAGEQKKIWVYNGYILDEHFNSLMVLTVKDYYSTAPENCRILVSSEFITNPIYKNVWKKIDTDYIQDAYAKDIEVRIINSKKIDKVLFPSKPPIVYDNLTQLTDMMIEMNQYFNAETFAPAVKVIGLNQKVTPLLDDTHNVSNLLISYRNEVQINMLHDFNGTRVGRETIIALDINKSFDDFEAFLRYAYSHSMGAVLKFSTYMEAYVGRRVEFSLDTVNNTLACHHSGKTYPLEVVDYDPLAEYEAAQQENVQENVNLDTLLEDTDMSF